MTEREEQLVAWTSRLLGRDTSQMKLNDVIEELAYALEIARMGQIQPEGGIRVQ